VGVVANSAVVGTVGGLITFPAAASIESTDVPNCSAEMEVPAVEGVEMPRRDLPLFTALSHWPDIVVGPL